MNWQALLDPTMCAKIFSSLRRGVWSACLLLVEDREQYHWALRMLKLGCNRNISIVAIIPDELVGSMAPRMFERVVTRGD